MSHRPSESEHARRDLARLLGVPYHEQRRLDALTAHWVVRHHPWAVPALCALWWLVGFACGVLWPRL
jgi:hypothetical protein